MAGFTLSEWIDRSPAVVFDFLTDASNSAKVMHNIKGSEKLTDGEVGVGTRYLETRIINDKEEQTELEVTVFERPQKYAVQVVQNGITMTYNYNLTPENDGTRVDMEAVVTAGGIKKAMVPVVANILKKEDGEHLQQLKEAMAIYA